LHPQKFEEHSTMRPGAPLGIRWALRPFAVSVSLQEREAQALPPAPSSCFPSRLDDTHLIKDLHLAGKTNNLQIIGIGTEFWDIFVSEERTASREHGFAHPRDAEVARALSSTQ
jgi:hypothetical protein